MGVLMTGSKCTTVGDLDFVYLDSNGKPHRVRKIDGEYWICWLHPDKFWVTLRKVETSPELWHMQHDCVDWKHHELYEFGIPFHASGWPAADSPAFDRSMKIRENK
jgi:hypothetical protein